MKKIVALALLLSAVPTLDACDICGCSSQGTNLGLLPGVSSHFIGVRYHYRTFNSEHPPILSDGQDVWSSDHFSTIELWGRWSVLPRLEVFGFLPVNSYAMQEHHGASVVHRNAKTGLGDASLMLNAVLLRTADNNPTAALQQQWMLGGGVKAPTGAYGEVDNERGLVLPNMQMGTGSWDFSLVTNYRLLWQQWGVNVNASYRYNTPNALRYQFGAVALAAMDFMHVFEAVESGWRLIPQWGIRWEHHARDYSNKSRGDRNAFSGGQFVHASVGADLYWNSWGLNLKVELPVYQDFAQGFIDNQCRLTAGVLFLIPTQKNKI